MTHYSYKAKDNSLPRKQMWLESDRLKAASAHEKSKSLKAV